MKKFLRFLGMLLSLSGFAAFAWWWFIRQSRKPAPSPQSLITDPDDEFSLSRNGKQLYAQWRREGRATLYLAQNREQIERDKPTAFIEDGQSIIVDSLDLRGRYYGEIEFDDGRRISTVERFLPIDSVPNFRDIGGYANHEGFQVKWGMVYRASALDRLSQEDAQALENLGLSLVCDIRTTEESISNPNTLPSSIPQISIPPISYDNRWQQLRQILFQQGFLESWLLDLYCRVILDENPQVIAGVFKQLADENNLPILIHCAAGKDRTGIVVALLLCLLGVDEVTILADYSLSNREYGFFKRTTAKAMGQLRFLGLSDRDLDYLLIAQPDTMRQTLAYLREKYASIENYLLSHAGMQQAELDAIRRHLLE